MHKKQTSLIHSKIANDMMNYINNHINTDINIDQVAYELGISKPHLHKIFKEQMGTNIYETIKSIRLQKASNLLITNRKSTITQVASICGYSSQTSFIRAFKQRFLQTPKVWRNGGYKEYSNNILINEQNKKTSSIDFSYIKPKIVNVKRRVAYYIRHKGYDEDIYNIWLKMQAWTYTNNITNFEQIGIYHDNPIITPASDCHYVACIVPKDNQVFLNNSLPSFDIQECICLTFDIEGKHSDILELIQWVYHSYLPNSGFETITIPSYIIFDENNFTNQTNMFKGTYHVPIRYT